MVGLARGAVMKRQKNYFNTKPTYILTDYTICSDARGDNCNNVPMEEYEVYHRYEYLIEWSTNLSPI